MKDILNTYSFHDAFMVSFECKTTKDYFDYCTVILESEGFDEIFGGQIIRVVFIGTYKILSNIQMWISGKDSIREFYVVKESNELREIDNLKNKGFLPKAEFTHFKMTLNTSGSEIEIIAQNFVIELIE